MRVPKPFRLFAPTVVKVKPNGIVVAEAAGVIARAAANARNPKVNFFILPPENCPDGTCPGYTLCLELAKELNRGSKWPALRILQNQKCSGEHSRRDTAHPAFGATFWGRPGQQRLRVPWRCQAAPSDAPR